MIKLEKLLKVTTLALPLILLSSRVSMDELPKKCYNYISTQRIAEAIVAPKNVFGEIPAANEKVLKLVKKLDGTKVPAGQDESCWTAVKYLYDSAGVLMDCYYAVAGGEKFNFKNEITGNKYISLIVGKTREKDGGIAIVPISPSRCKFNPSNMDSEKELDNLVPGDLISYLIDYRAHSAIFVGWGNKKERDALLFDWGARDNKGKMEYRIYETDLSKNSHPVFIHWKLREIIQKEYNQ
jgi:hypothetical protein